MIWRKNIVIIIVLMTLTSKKTHLTIIFYESLNQLCLIWRLYLSIPATNSLKTLTIKFWFKFLSRKIRFEEQFNGIMSRVCILRITKPHNIFQTIILSNCYLIHSKLTYYSNINSLVHCIYRGVRVQTEPINKYVKLSFFVADLK